MSLCTGRQWFDFIVAGADRWRSLVRSLFSVESISDSNMDISDSAIAWAFVCDKCDGRPSFATAEGLLQHKREFHAFQDPVCKYIDGSSQSPVRSSSFHTRLRCLAHAADTRRDACRTRLLSGNFPTISPDEQRRLECIDREERRCARKAGHSHPIAVGSA